MKKLFAAFIVFIGGIGGFHSQNIEIGYLSSQGSCDGIAILADSTSFSSWSWIDTDSIAVLQTGGGTISGLCAGTYYLNYTDTVSNTVSFTIQTDPCIGFSVWLDAISESIPGSCDGVASPQITGGTSPFNYQWGVVSGNQTTFTAVDLCYGWHYLEVTDANECSLFDSVFVDVDTNFSSCMAFFYHYLNDTGAVEFYNYGTAGSTYLWDFGDGNTSTEANPVHEYVTQGQYIVNFTITDSTGCYMTMADDVSSIPLTSCNAYYISINDSIDQNLFYLVNLTTAVDSVSYSWDMGDGTVINNENPIHTFSGNGPYMICLSIVDGDSCTSTYCRNVQSFAKSEGIRVQVVAPGETYAVYASVGNMEDLTHLELYPNPVVDMVNFDQSIEVKEIRVYSIAGELVYRSFSNDHSVDISTLPEGIYVFKAVLLDNTSVTRKFVKR